MNDPEIKKPTDIFEVTPISKMEISNPLDAIVLSKEQMKLVVTEAAIGTLSLKIPILGDILELSERIDQGVKEEKLQNLLKKYNDHFSSQDETIERLKFLTATTPGKVLFSKVIRLLDNVPDEKSIGLLANILKNITNLDIEKRFQEHAYALSQIDRLTPEALIILSKYAEWKDCSLSGTTTTSKHTISGDWDSQIATFLASKLKITDSDIKLRIAHSFWELESTGMIVLEGSFVKLEDIGTEVYRYIL